MSGSVLALESVDGALQANGKPFVLKGVTWWGAESNKALPAGLDVRSADELLALIARYGFNTIKIPFLHQYVLFDEPVPAQSFDHLKNPFLLDDNGRPLRYIEMLRVLARRAAGHGLLVWLGAYSLEGLWYSRSISEITVLDSWTAVARRLCMQWNIVGVDLKSLLTVAAWGKGGAIDWDVAAAKLGDHVNGKCPRWLIGVEGVGSTPGAQQDPEMEFATMYPTYHDGENLVGARRRPVMLRDHSRLVYMPHTYGPGVRSMSYMETDDFPENSELVWDEHFLFLRKRAEIRQPSAVIVHLGGPFEGSPRDMAWQTWALKACAAHGLSLFYDGLNPLSGVGGQSPFSPSMLSAAAAGGLRSSPNGPRVNNTGGLMMPDWRGVRNGKLQQLAAVPATRVASILRATGSPPPPPYIDASADSSFMDDLGLSPPPPSPPPDATLPVSTPALAVVALVLLVLLGQLGAFARPLAPMRRRLDRCAPSALLPLLYLVWAVLNVPNALAIQTAESEMMAAPLPKARSGRRKRGLGGEQTAGEEEEEQLVMADGAGADEGEAAARGGKRAADGGGHGRAASGRVDKGGERGGGRDSNGREPNGRPSAADRVQGPGVQGPGGRVRSAPAGAGSRVEGIQGSRVQERIPQIHTAYRPRHMHMHMHMHVHMHIGHGTCTQVPLEGIVVILHIHAHAYLLPAAVDEPLEGIVVVLITAAA